MIIAILREGNSEAILGAEVPVRQKINPQTKLVGSSRDMSTYWVRSSGRSDRRGRRRS